MTKLIFALLFLSSFAQAERFIVEAGHPLSSSEIKALSGLKIEKFTSINHPYFSKLYTVTGVLSKEALQKQKWVKSVENSIELEKFSLIPSENPQRLVEDELFPYQWSLLNQGQSYVREKDDIHNLPLQGVDGKDIGWKNMAGDSSTNRPIVAVLDSGVDLNHPDIRENLWRNEKECGLDPLIDHDQNLLPGDCEGWNFTESLESPEAKSPQDMDGHGTHVAGIIAASQNSFGIVGVNPRALIMPIKVMRDSNSNSDISASESFARGIIYATDMGANIINLSLGWPRSLETKHLREAIYYAISKNVIIVAAAGNNNSSEPLFPCAYDGVICSTASTLDGQFAGFSNYGGHIDAVAPGEAILGLNPVLFEPEYFSIPGYEVKSGTSQAAPMLAGMLSLLKAKEPKLALDDIFARLYSLPQITDKKKFILGGAATIDGLSQTITGPVVRPVLKRVRQIVLNGKNIETKLILPIRNYGQDATDLTVKVESLSSGLSFENTVLRIDSLKKSEVKDLSFPVIVKDLTAESFIKMKVTLTSSEGSLIFYNELPVVRDIKIEPSFKKSEFTFAKESLPLGNVVNGKINSFLNTIESYGKSSKHEFFIRRNLKEEKKLELTVFSREKNFVQEAPRKIIINQFSKLFNFIRIDLNLDGVEDYVIQSINEDENGKFIEFSFYDEELNPLWGNFQAVKVKLDVAIDEMSTLSFTRMDHPTLGKMMVPTFFTQGQLPKIDQVKDFYERWNTDKELRLYYLEPILSDMSFRIRALTTPAWKETIKKDLGVKWFETVMPENILPVSIEDAKRGVVRLILSVGQGTKREIFISTFDTKNSILGTKLPQIVLQSEGVDPLFSISATGLEVVGDTFFNIYDRSRSKIVMTKNSDQSWQLPYIHESETDVIMGHLASFDKGQDKFSVLQTRDELVGLSSKNGKVIKTTRPKLRYSFLTDKVLSELYHPVIYKRGDIQSGALFVDSTAVTANRVYLFEEQDGKLVSSIQNSLLVSPNCKALNPHFSEENGSHEFVFLCLEDKNWVLRTYEMN